MSKEEQKFLCTNLNSDEEPWGFLYLLFNVSKVPLKTLPVMSYCGNLLHPLGQIITEWLQLLARMQKLYFLYLFTLKKELDRQKSHRTPACLFVMKLPCTQISKQDRYFTTLDGLPSKTRSICLSHPRYWWTHWYFSWQITFSNLETHIGCKKW